MNTVFILVLIIAAIAGIGGALIKINAGKDDNVGAYRGPATLIAKLTDDEGGFICQFESDGKIINAFYGGDSPELKIGDTVNIVWEGWYYHFPQVMDAADYDKDQS